MRLFLACTTTAMAAGVRNDLCGALRRDDFLKRGEWIYSSTGLRLVAQNDGNVVVYDDSSDRPEVWATGSAIAAHERDYQLTFQGDGNLCVNVPGDTQYDWCLRGRPGKHLLTFFDQGEQLWVGGDDANPVWAIGTGTRDCFRPSPPPQPPSSPLPSPPPPSGFSWEFLILLPFICIFVLPALCNIHKIQRGVTRRASTAKAPQAVKPPADSAGTIPHKQRQQKQPVAPAAGASAAGASAAGASAAGKKLMVHVIVPSAVKSGGSFITGGCSRLFLCFNAQC